MKIIEVLVRVGLFTVAVFIFPFFIAKFLSTYFFPEDDFFVLFSLLSLISFLFITSDEL